MQAFLFSTTDLVVLIFYAYSSFPSRQLHLVYRPSQSSITVEVPGLYSLEVRDGNGCPGKDTIEIVQKNCYTCLYIPTAFTPNRDNLNDVFMARVYGVLVSFRLEVYNRNGERVFMTTNPVQAWNGQFGGVDQPTGVFVWQCFYQFAGREKEYEKGTVVLVR